MSTRFFTNDGENTLLNKFKRVFEHNIEKEIVRLSNLLQNVTSEYDRGTILSKIDNQVFQLFELEDSDVEIIIKDRV